MRIDGVGSDSTRPAGARSVDKTSDKPKKSRKADAASAAARDRIEISAAGRAAAAGLSGAGAPDAESLSVERVEAIRARIDAGVYDSPEIREDVARRLLDSGDLSPEPAAGQEDA